MIKRESGVRSQESGVKLALCIGFNLEFVPPNYATCCMSPMFDLLMQLQEYSTFECSWFTAITANCKGLQIIKKWFI
jgi:hypothetical protein